ncbi:MAG TPA: RNA polymerase subunit sigma-70 [Thermoleophilaceae bacterium]|nr:RNA polymerase subunit sigma-70 [Thermoleophilaceae bacterium]
MRSDSLPRSHAAFSELAERYRPEMQVHCYRLLGSFEDSEDAVQETLLRAWRRRETFEGRSTFRAWLYRIATNACLDALGRRERRQQTATGPEVPWLQPFPDRLLEEAAPSQEEPGAVVIAKETIELTFIAAIQHLPPRQRAVLILRDVLDWTAKDTAALLEASVASVNSALQRARASLKRHLPERRAEWAPGLDPTREERALLERYMNATEEADAGAFVEMMREDARFSMPPEPGVWVGRELIVGAWHEAFDTESFGHMRGVVTRANSQPAVACYHRRPGKAVYREMALDVLRIEDGAVAEIVTFPPDLFPAFGLPAELPVT